ncbi:hypothetical protein ROE7235_00475 [Roseibaca ekhonensis]|jgi:rhodanese-related sulfurtransferase|uniref:Rhodanese domain-containing protein n=1 Tax=Roseinatronobacter ekhonensis TaxID=254356 RepID=A0A3B0MM72_9RHOB|nr:rhodanese-like domain-containing protein [Roseibaca ekhonensis]SUZ30749.1 hypothetical protein ROE7235_00475 [Roseibaca ekhonensis]
MRVVLLALFLLLPVTAQSQELEGALSEYLDFATEAEGIIAPAQLTADLLPQVQFIDVRNAAAFGTNPIAGAIHIPWREIVARLDEVPASGLAVLYCDTGAISAQAMFAARLMGRDNVLVLQGGRAGWP